MSGTLKILRKIRKIWVIHSVHRWSYFFQKNHSKFPQQKKSKKLLIPQQKRISNTNFRLSFGPELLVTTIPDHSSHLEKKRTRTPAAAGRYTTGYKECNVVNARWCTNTLHFSNPKYLHTIQNDGLTAESLKNGY